MLRPCVWYYPRMDAFLSPYTGDYTGEHTRTLENAVYIRLMTPLGGWWADPSLGSRLHELMREKDVPRIRTLARQYAEQALASLVTSGRAQSVSVTADMPHDGRCLLRVEVIDLTGRRSLYSYPVKVS